MMVSWLVRLVCVWTHGGGQIKRDPRGLINWQCAKCGRWSRYPVSREDEQLVVDMNLSLKEGDQ